MSKHLYSVELHQLSKAELLDNWARLFRNPAPVFLNKSYLVKHLAWQMEFGGLEPRVQKQVDKLVVQYEKTKSLKPCDIKRIAKFDVTAGTRFIREFKGEKYEVTTLDMGFSYNGKTYKSLSAIANEITGTRWNGKKFFGVAK